MRGVITLDAIPTAMRDFLWICYVNADCDYLAYLVHDLALILLPIALFQLYTTKVTVMGLRIPRRRWPRRSCNLSQWRPPLFCSPIERTNENMPHSFDKGANVRRITPYSAAWGALFRSRPCRAKTHHPPCAEYSHLHNVWANLQI